MERDQDLVAVPAALVVELRGAVVQLGHQLEGTAAGLEIDDLRAHPLHFELEHVGIEVVHLANVGAVDQHPAQRTDSHQCLSSISAGPARIRWCSTRRGWTPS